MECFDVAEDRSSIKRILFVSPTASSISAESNQLHSPPLPHSLREHSPDSLLRNCIVTYTSSESEVISCPASSSFGEPDAVVIDLRSPTVDASSICCRLSPNLARLPVIGLISAPTENGAQDPAHLPVHEVVAADEIRESIPETILRRARYRSQRAIGERRLDDAVRQIGTGQPLGTVLSTLLDVVDGDASDFRSAFALLDGEGKRITDLVAPRWPVELRRNLTELLSRNDLDDHRLPLLTLLDGTRIRELFLSLPVNHPIRRRAAELEMIGTLGMPISNSFGRIVGALLLCPRARADMRGNGAEPPVDLSIFRPGRGDGTHSHIHRAALLSGIAIEQRQSDSALQYRYEFEKLIFAAATRFIHIARERIEPEAARTLDELSRFTGADRASIFQLQSPGHEVRRLHEWCAEGVPTGPLTTVAPSIANFPWLGSKLAARETILIRHPDDLPPQAKAEREAFTARGAHSLLIVPMVCGRDLLGFVLMESLSRLREWAPDVVVLMQLAAQILANAVGRKQVEEELSHSQARSRLNEAHLRLTFANVNLGMATCTLDGHFTSANEALCKMLGFTTTEMLERSLTDVTHPDDRAIPRRKLKDLLRGTVDPIELDRRLITNQQSVVHTHTRLAIVRDDNHRPLYVVLEVDDITERKRWEEEYLRASKLESLGILAGGIAHDFNNVLMAILGSVSCIRLEPPTEISLSNRLADIEKAVLRARDLTHQLLTFSKGGAPIKRTASILDIIKDTIGFTLSGSGVKSRIIANPALWSVQVDEGQISQVVNNIILNASQAMPDGGTVTVACGNHIVARGDDEELGRRLRPGRYVKISVQDEGCGIAPEHLSKIFDPFFTTKSEGTGLGLATTYSIVRRHRGLIEFESILGAGTTVHIYLPAAPHGAVVSRRDTGSVRHGVGRILVMDDESQVRATAGRMLAHLGYQVDFASDGEETIGQYVDAMKCGRPYDAVIMDLTIPGGMGGLQTIRELKKIDPGICAIVSSGYADGPVMAEHHKHGFRGVMAKPYDLPTLSQALHDALGRSNERAA